MGNEPRRKLLGGRPASCRTCKFVMDPRFGWYLTGRDLGFCKPVCCREAPPSEFVWTIGDVEPFCGQYEPDEGTAPADPRLSPAEKARTAKPEDLRALEDEMIPMYGAPVPPEKVPPELRRPRR